jgi:hypothetical protein
VSVFKKRGIPVRASSAEGSSTDLDCMRPETCDMCGQEYHFQCEPCRAVCHYQVIVQSWLRILGAHPSLTFTPINFFMKNAVYPHLSKMRHKFPNNASIHFQL